MCSLSLWEGLSNGTINFEGVTLTLIFDLLLNIGHNCLTVRDQTFIFGICVPKTLCPELSNGIIVFIRPSSDGMYYSMVMSVRPSIHLSVSHSFPHFSPQCFDVLSWNCVCNFLLMNIQSSLSVVNFRQFLLELCPFWNLEYWKYAVFRTFLLHALT